MHVDKVLSRHTSKSGETREHEAAVVPLVPQSDGKVGKETLPNLSMLSAGVVDVIEAVLKGATLVDAGTALTVTRSRPYRDVALVHAAARWPGPVVLGPA